MIGLIGYNLCADNDALNPAPTRVNNINYTRLQNGIFDHFNVKKDVKFDYSTIIPTDWDTETLMNADFNGHASAGNVTQVASGVTAVRIKRRIKGTFDWITIREIPVNTPEDMSFVITDNLALNNKEYEYAFVPMIEDVEGSYIIETVMSKYQGVFVCDVDTVFKFIAGVEYTGNQDIQQVGIFQPYNRQFPVIVSNGMVQYETGSIGGWVLPEDYEETGNLDRDAIVREREVLLKFLLNKKPKAIKDSNGNAWLVYFTGNPTINYENNYGQGLMKVAAEWVQVGDINNRNDLYENGMIPTEA